MGTKITATRERVFLLQTASEDDTIFLIRNVLFGGRPDANRVLGRSWLQPGAVFKKGFQHGVCLQMLEAGNSFVLIFDKFSRLTYNILNKRTESWVKSSRRRE